MSPLCIQKGNYVITLYHCGFFMPDLKLKSSSLSIVGANWKNVITAAGLVYPRLHFPWSFICILNNRIYIKADVFSVVHFYDPACCKIACESNRLIPIRRRCVVELSMTIVGLSFYLFSAGKQEVRSSHFAAVALHFASRRGLIEDVIIEFDPFLVTRTSTK